MNSLGSFGFNSVNQRTAKRFRYPIQQLGSAERCVLYLRVDNCSALIIWMQPSLAGTSELGVLAPVHSWMCLRWCTAVSQLAIHSSVTSEFYVFCLREYAPKPFRFRAEPCSPAGEVKAICQKKMAAASVALSDQVSNDTEQDGQNTDRGSVGRETSVPAVESDAVVKGGAQQEEQELPQEQAQQEDDLLHGQEQREQQSLQRPKQHAQQSLQKREQQDQQSLQRPEQQDQGLQQEQAQQDLPKLQEHVSPEAQEQQRQELPAGQGHAQHHKVTGRKRSLQGLQCDPVESPSNPACVGKKPRGKVQQSDSSARAGKNNPKAKAPARSERPTTGEGFMDQLCAYILKQTGERPDFSAWRCEVCSAPRVALRRTGSRMCIERLCILMYNTCSVHSFHCIRVPSSAQVICNC